LQVLAADSVKRLILDGKCHVGAFDQTFQRKKGVIGLNYDIRGAVKRGRAREN
jgi:hypothetical protein